MAHPENHPPLTDALSALGCSRVIDVNCSLSAVDQIDYLDLLPKGGRKAPTKVSAVAENQGVALLYTIDAREATVSAQDIIDSQHLLANRSSPAWLGVLRPGSLEVYPIGFRKPGADLDRVEVIELESSAAPGFFQRLAQSTFAPDRTRDNDYVFRKIFDLLTATAETFISGKELTPLDVLSMTGRTLFFRFLIDRKIVTPEDLPDICPEAANLKDAFSSPEKAAATSAWLDVTYNGDFLPLISDKIPEDDTMARTDAYLDFFRDVGDRTGDQIFLHLRAILCGWTVIGRTIQTEFDWGDFDFAHIPVGVLSQVYERFSHLADPEQAKSDSVHYTPRIIAELIVDQAVASTEDPATARVLDPTCGAGIFLVLAFRSLVAQRWVKDEQRPNCRVIQDILYNQIRGFDKGEPALRLAALSLYITAIELNATHRPPKLLKFPRNLRGIVLHSFDHKLGSLADSAAEQFAGQFDIVVGNPPWTALGGGETSTALNKQFTRIGREHLNARGCEDLAVRYTNPNKNPDIPFLWRACTWAKLGAVIVYALPARVFHRSTNTGGDAIEALFRSMKVTGLVNGANLRKTAVWAGVDMPWCILCAKNLVGDLDESFWFSAPTKDANIHAEARFRIDYESATALTGRQILERPWLPKVYSLGTRRDEAVMEQLLSSFPRTIEEFWKAWDPRGDRTGQGYNRSAGQKQRDASFLCELPDFVRPSSDVFEINNIEFSTFYERQQTATAYRPKTEALYQPPLVIIPKSPGDRRTSSKAFRSSRALAFEQIYYGYSLAQHPQAELTSAFLYLLPHSLLFNYFALIKSGSLGSDRMMFIKKDFDSLPFPDPAELNITSAETALSLADRLERDETKPWDEIDDFLFELYGLGVTEAQTIRDTLFAAAPYRRAGQDAYARPTPLQRESFKEKLTELLSPFFEVVGASVRITCFAPSEIASPWAFLDLRLGSAPEGSSLCVALVRAAMTEADRSGASRVVIHYSDQSGLLLAILDERRWWTATRAAICATHILRNHLDAFGLAPNPVA